MSVDSDDKRRSADSSESNTDSSHESDRLSDTEFAVTAVPADADSRTEKQSTTEGASDGIGKLAPIRVLGDFELMHELGRGGMGVVYEARQRSLGKRVAVKVLPFSAMLDRRAVKRFQNEAWAAAQLQHRNIVPVYQVGHERDAYFYAMQYIDGGDLGDLYKCLREAAQRRPSATRADSPRTSQRKKSTKVAGTPTGGHATTPAGDVDGAADTSSPVRDSTHKSGWSRGDTLASQHLLELVEKNRSTSVPEFLAALVGMGVQVAEALHYAHEMGIVHRDVKPSNLLLDTEGEVWVADFGLAQIQSDAGMTATGAIVGTLRYMSPEQALGKRIGVDHRTDIYSLGVTLYELLTLRRAFSGDNRETILRNITFDDPIRPRKIDRRIPVELETIVMKAMSKNPADRYQTAAEMAEDFRLFRDDKPIKGRKPTIPQHVVRWSRRNRHVVASAAMLLVIAFIASVVVAVISVNLFATTAAALETEKEQKAEVQRLLQRSEGLRLAANSSIELEGNPTRALLLAIEGGKRYPGVDTNTAILEALDAQHEFRTLTGHSGPVGHLAFNADGTKLVSAAIRSRFDHGPDPAMIWDTATGQLMGVLQEEKTITSAAFSPDKYRILTASSPRSEQATDDVNGELVGRSPSLWDSIKLEKLLSFKNAFLFEAHPAVFDPDGRRAVFPSLGHTATIYDCVAGHDLVSLSGHDKRVVFAAFSPQGDRVVTASDDNTVRVWDADSGRQVYQFDLWQKRDPSNDQCVIDTVVFRADGRQLVTGSTSYGVHLWDLATGERINDEHLKGGIASYWPDGLQLLTHLPNGRDLAIRDVSSGRPLRTLKPENGSIRLAVISPSGRWIATHSRSDSTFVRIWDAARGEVNTVLKGHQLVVNDMAFSPDSKMIATASTDKTVKLWHVANGRDRATFSTPGWSADPQAVASPDGKQLAIVGLEPITAGRVVDFQQPQRSIELLSRIWMPDFTSTRFVASRGNRLSIHSVADGAELDSITSANGSYDEAAINQDGDRAAAFSGGQAITLWFPDEDRRLSLSVGPTQVYRLKFNPDGDRLISVSADGFARVWDADTGELLASLQNDAKVFNVVCSPNANQIAAVTDQNRAIIWDLDTLEKLTTLRSPGVNFDHAEFSFDGTQLVSYRAVESDAVHVWDTTTGNLESKLDVTGVVHVAMHPARSEALVTSTEQGAVIWQYDQNVRRPVTDKPMIHGVFSSDGSQFVIGSEVSPPAQPWQRMPAPTTITPSTLERWSRDDLVRLESIGIPAESLAGFHLSRDGRAFVNTTRGFGLVNHDVASHQPTAYIPGHIAPISASLFTSDSRRLITASWDQTISVWNASDGKQLKTLTGHNSPVYCAAATDHDRLLVSGAHDGQCILWDLESGQIKQRLSLAQSPILHVAFDPAGNRILAITSEHSLHLYDLQAEQELDLNVGAKQIAWAEYSPDGSSLLVIPHAAAKAAVEDQSPETQDENLDHEVLIVPLNGDAITPVVHEGLIVTAHYHPTGEQIVSATQEGIITLRNARSGRVEKSFSIPGINVKAAVLDQSGEFLAVAGVNRVTIWKINEAIEWLSVSRKRSFPTPLHRYSPFVPEAQKVVTRRIDNGEFRDWPIEPLEFAASRTPRLLSTQERSRFLIEQPPVTND